jgi:hypothetical protein
MANVESPPVVGNEPRLETEPRVEPEPSREAERRVELEPRHEARPRREAISHSVTAAGSTAGSLLGLAAVVLSILALAGLLTVPLTAIAVIAAGAAALAEGASLAARSSLRGGPDAARAVILSGVGADTIVALAAIVLGVLSLLGIRPLTFLPIAILVLGASLLFSGATAIVERVRSIMVREGIEAPQDNISGAAGVNMLVGAGALVLGILGVLGGSPVLLTLIATLSMGASLMLSGAALGARIATGVRHWT